MKNKWLAECKWPKLTERYEIGLQMAIDYLLENYEPVGIIASGTIIRGTPDKSSDLDIYVIHKEPFRQRLQKYFNGVPVEIFINPPFQVEKYFKEEQAARRPLTAHMLSTGFVILDTDPMIEKLRQKAEGFLLAPPAAPRELIYQRYLIALLYEDAVDVVEKDPDTANMIANRAVVEMLDFCFVKAGKFLPRAKSLLTELEKVDENVSKLARSFYQATDIKEKVELAGKISDAVVGERGFFEWASPPNEVSE
jgi:predicted nucleotidyltransferase